MMSEKSLDEKGAARRRRAELLVEQAGGRPVELSHLKADDIAQLVHELQVQQMELELQNEELHQMREALERSRDQYSDLFDFAPVGYFTIDRRGVIVEANLTGAMMLRIPRGELIGRAFNTFVAAGDQDTYYFYQKDLFTNRSPQRCEIDLVRQDQVKFYARLEGIASQVRQDQVVQIRTVVSDISELAQAEQVIRQRNRELATRNRITTAIAGSLELSEVLFTVQKLLSEQLALPGGALLLYNEPEDQLEVKVSWGLPKTLPEEFQIRPVIGAHNERTIREKATLFWSDFREVALFQTLGLDRERSEWRSHLCIPLMAQDEVQGVLELFREAPNEFSIKQIAFLKNLGQQIGVAIQNACLFEQVRDGRERLRQLAQRVVSVQEDERRRVSRELHDEAGQALTVLKFTLQTMLSDLPPEDEGAVDVRLLRDQLLEAIALCDTTMSGIRLLAHDLRPSSLDDLGLQPALEGYCHDFNERTQLSVRYEGEEPPEMPAAVSICLYRFLQEALTNVARHAHARHVTVVLRCDANTVSLSVRDDGIGFERGVESGEAAHDRGVGILGMQERLEAVGGWLAIDSRRDEGSCLVAYIPLPSQAA